LHGQHSRPASPCVCWPTRRMRASTPARAAPRRHMERAKQPPTTARATKLRHTSDCSRAAKRTTAQSGGVLSACTKHSAPPRAAAAPAFICRARPRCVCTTAAPALRAARTVLQCPHRISNVLKHAPRRRDQRAHEAECAATAQARPSWVSCLQCAARAHPSVLPPSTTMTSSGGGKRLRRCSTQPAMHFSSFSACRALRRRRQSARPWQRRSWGHRRHRRLPERLPRPAPPPSVSPTAAAAKLGTQAMRRRPERRYGPRCPVVLEEPLSLRPKNSPVGWRCAGQRQDRVDALGRLARTPDHEGGAITGTIMDTDSFEVSSAQRSAVSASHACHSTPAACTAGTCTLQGALQGTLKP